MAYNVTAWNTKEIRDLKWSMGEFKRLMDENGHGFGVHISTAGIKLSMTEMSYIVITATESVVDVSEISLSGEFSGRLCLEVIEPLLAKSTGTLIASRVWEGGDHIDKLTSIEGVVTVEPIEI